MGIFEKKEPEPVMVHGKALNCAVCQHSRFWQRKAQLHSAVATFFNLEWTNPTAQCFVCEKCGYIYWFLVPDEG